MCAGHKKYAVDCRNAAGEREMGPLCGSLPRYAGALAGLQRISIHCEHHRRPPGRLRTAWLKTVTVHGDSKLYVLTLTGAIDTMARNRPLCGDCPLRAALGSLRDASPR